MQISVLLYPWHPPDDEVDWSVFLAVCMVRQTRPHDPGLTLKYDRSQ